MTTPSTILKIKINILSILIILLNPPNILVIDNATNLVTNQTSTTNVTFLTHLESAKSVSAYFVKIHSNLAHVVEQHTFQLGLPKMLQGIMLYTKNSPPTHTSTKIFYSVHQNFLPTRKIPQ